MKNQKLKEVISNTISPRFKWITIDRNLVKEEQDFIDGIYNILNLFDCEKNDLNRNNNIKHVIHIKRRELFVNFYSSRRKNEPHYWSELYINLNGKLKRNKVCLKKKCSTFYNPHINSSILSYNNFISLDDNLHAIIPLSDVENSDMYELFLNNYQFKNIEEVVRAADKINDFILSIF